MNAKDLVGGDFFGRTLQMGGNLSAGAISTKLVQGSVGYIQEDVTAMKASCGTLTVREGELEISDGSLLIEVCSLNLVGSLDTRPGNVGRHGERGM